jgi:outer membrane receptor protein involved in Fe transport
LEWKGLKNWKAYLDVNNILGEEYVDIANVVLPGASMRIGLQYRL